MVITMDNYTIMWLVLAVMFLILEAVTTSLISIWFVVGSLAALIAAALSASIGLQIGVFVLVTALMLIFTMPLAKRFLKKGKHATNYDMVLEAEGIVIEEINGIDGTGQVKVGGSVWSAKSLGGEIIPKDSRVTVKDVQGVKAVVILKEEES